MKWLYSLLTTGTCLVSTFSSHACTYDGQFSNPFAESYPGSLDVAIATYDALDLNYIEPVSALDGQQGLRRVSWWLQLMSQRFSSELTTTSHIYLVDSHLWSQLTKDNQIKVHSSPQNVGSTNVLLLSEAALSALVNKQIGFQQALDLGIINFSS